MLIYKIESLILFWERASTSVKWRVRQKSLYRYLPQMNALDEATLVGPSTPRGVSVLSALRRINSRFHWGLRYLQSPEIDHFASIIHIHRWTNRYLFWHLLICAVSFWSLISSRQDDHSTKYFCPKEANKP